MEEGQAAPYRGLLVHWEDEDLFVSVLEDYNRLRDDLGMCRSELMRIKAKPTPFWRRVSFWVPVASACLAGGVVIGVQAGK